ncbi:DUF3168 domain-containing protein [Defluviimonas aestuarii]|uniref:DUF3168 domain-containing protein n=1 Tax=Albidovulum aestuarii TaxID=1130726 RepID=UPI00249C844A|nr:DUF3168 domain-containing protein [Defluviimonas aestuarii]MDI3335868.1 DUF3168 domain-containing protein [Defluviimonas aestuarii]
MSESNALQAMIVTCLKADAAVAAIVGQKVYDKPAATVSAPYLSIGPSDYVPEDADCIDGRTETVQIDCWSEAQDGKREVKALADAVKKALHGYAGTLTIGALVSLEAKLVRVLDDPDGITLHGVVQVEALIEEA